MRNEFFKLLQAEMRRDDSIFFIAADMGLGLVESIQQEFPDRFLNTGISEQNMIGIAAGLCNTGFRPFCYTISNFITERCFEQIRNDVCLHKYPVTIVGTSTGFDNGMLGPTHQVIDDIGCMKILPEMNIYSPSSVGVIRIVFQEIINNKKPAYIRIGKATYNAAPTGGDEINYIAVQSSNPDVLIITHGSLLESCVKAAGESKLFSVCSMNRIKPLDKKEIKTLLGRFSKVVVVEDHFVTSGLYNSICQAAAEMRLPGGNLYSIGTPEVYEDIVGGSDFFADRYSYSPQKIADFVSRI